MEYEERYGESREDHEYYEHCPSCFGEGCPDCNDLGFIEKQNVEDDESEDY